MNKIYKIADTICWVILMVAVVGFIGAIQYKHVYLKIYKETLQQQEMINVTQKNKQIEV
jgi:hypothetical protein